MINKHSPKKLFFLTLVLVIMFVYFSTSLYLENTNNNKQNSLTNISQVQNLPSKDTTPEPTKSPESTEAQGSRPETKLISPNATLILEKKYTKCSHSINQKMDMSPDMVNLAEEDLKRAYKDWQVKKFSPTEVVLYQEIQSKCPNHFTLKNKDGYVAIYYQTPINNVSLKELTSITVKSLPKDIQDKLIKGINVESEEELKSRLEDFNS